ncbi:hypothetical protein CJ014_24580 [Pleomorphomonas carboxyditropha]|uniref:Uncharacterized protein n=1 Tax=Pleomorphomonas carboxyditropha TaxID=2023338 RepID=A0A2G9WPJ1_9HYPH|nr:hypothetical protein CJ014_24580 [Pleomorphomonas carboxyditropha]
MGSLLCYLLKRFANFFVVFLGHCPWHIGRIEAKMPQHGLPLLHSSEIHEITGGGNTQIATSRYGCVEIRYGSSLYFSENLARLCTDLLHANEEFIRRYIKIFGRLPL